MRRLGSGERGHHLLDDALAQLLPRDLPALELRIGRFGAAEIKQSTGPEPPAESDGIVVHGPVGADRPARGPARLAVQRHRPDRRNERTIFSPGALVLGRREHRGIGLQFRTLAQCRADQLGEWRVEPDQQRRGRQMFRRGQHHRRIDPQYRGEPRRGGAHVRLGAAQRHPRLLRLHRQAQRLAAVGQADRRGAFELRLVVLRDLCRLHGNVLFGHCTDQIEIRIGGGEQRPFALRVDVLAGRTLQLARGELAEDRLAELDRQPDRARTSIQTLVHLEHRSAGLLIGASAPSDALPDRQAGHEPQRRSVIGRLCLVLRGTHQRQIQVVEARQTQRGRQIDALHGRGHVRRRRVGVRQTRAEQHDTERERRAQRSGRRDHQRTPAGVPARARTGCVVSCTETYIPGNSS